MRLPVRCLLSLSLLVLPGALAAPAAAEEGEDDAKREEAERYFQRGLSYAKRGNGKKALENMEKALPTINDNVDLLYSLVQVCTALKDLRCTLLYGQAYVFAEDPSNTDDLQEVQTLVAESRKTLEKRKMPPSKVTFDLEPKGTPVEVQKVVLGRSGRHSAWLPPGTYKARGRWKDHHPWEGSFTVNDGEPFELTGKLEPMVFHGLLTIRTEPKEGVQVYIDDEPYGTTPIEDPIRLETRRYLLRFEKEGWERWVRYVDIKKDETYELKPKMERTPPPAGAGTK